MYAQVIEIRLEPARLRVLERFVQRELIPALRERSGFCGALGLTDRERAESLLVLLWETKEEAVRPLEVLFADSGTVTVWEVDARG